eukprot:5021356-Prymnesium_polylepis.2
MACSTAKLNKVWGCGERSFGPSTRANSISELFPGSSTSKSTSSNPVQLTPLPALPQETGSPALLNEQPGTQGGSRENWQSGASGVSSQFTQPSEAALAVSDSSSATWVEVTTANEQQPGIPSPIARERAAAHAARPGRTAVA